MDLPPSPPMAYPVPPLRLKPPSAAIVISLPSTGPLIWPGWHVPRLYLTWCKWVPKPIYRTSSPCSSPPFFFLHFHLPGSSPHSVSVLWLEPYLQGKIPPLHSQLLFFSPLFLPVFLSVNFCPPPPPNPTPTSTLPQPRPVDTAVLLQFIGSLQLLFREKEQGEVKERRDGEKLQGRRHRGWVNTRPHDKDLLKRAEQ